MISRVETISTQSAEAEKTLRSICGVWNAFKLLKNEYPSAAILLMDPSASFDMLVIDPIRDTLVAVEVKSFTGHVKCRETSHEVSTRIEACDRIERVLEANSSKVRHLS
jgi:hypothetical protein